MMIRSHMVRILLRREWMRLWKNPSALMLVGLLVAISLLIATSTPEPPRAMRCWVVYWEDSDWIEHLKSMLPEHQDVRIEPVTSFRRVGEELLYPGNSCAIEIRPPRPAKKPGPSATLRIDYRFRGKDPNVLMPFLQWFWPVTAHHFGDPPPIVQRTLPMGVATRAAALTTAAEDLKNASVSELVTVEVSATALLFVVQFFTCCHLLVSLTSQDRERGTLTALALTPVTMAELLAARFIFHLMISLAASGAVIAILKPSALPQPLLWIVLACTSLGLMAVGMTIATLSRSQTTAGLLTLSYMLGGGVVFYLAAQFSAFEWVKRAMFERYSFPLIYFSLKRPMGILGAPGLVTLLILTTAWIAAAASLFRRRGWR